MVVRIPRPSWYKGGGGARDSSPSAPGSVSDSAARDAAEEEAAVVGGVDAGADDRVAAKWEQRFYAVSEQHEREREAWQDRHSELITLRRRERDKYDAMDKRFDRERAAFREEMQREMERSKKLEEMVKKVEEEEKLKHAKEEARKAATEKGQMDQQDSWDGFTDEEAIEDDDSEEDEDYDHPLRSHPRWAERIEELNRFRSQHERFGNPPDNIEDFQKWVNEQRAYYSSKLHPESPLPESEDELSGDELGMECDLSTGDTEESDNDEMNLDKASNEERWRQRLEELLQYHSENGTFNVPQAEMLGNWVKLQRHNYQKWKRGEKSALTDERRASLEQAGVIAAWEDVDGDGRALQQRQQDRWEAQFEDLKAYKESNGHTNVPRSHPTLGNWLKKQRVEYTKWQKGEKTQLTDDRRQALEELGVEWKRLTRKPDLIEFAEAII